MTTIDIIPVGKGSVQKTVAFLNSFILSPEGRRIFEEIIYMKKNVGNVLTGVAALALIILDIILGGAELSDVQKETLIVLLVVCGCSVVYCFVIGEISQNFSQMDKLWSLLPIAYVWITAAKGGMKIRLVIYALIVTAWGVRLTINFARKGAYRLKFWTGKEDYRWSIVRQSPFFKPRFAWTVFDLLFISFYQNALVLAITLPALACMESTLSLGLFDYIAIIFAVAFLVLETVSDEYQWKFHQTKNKLLRGGKALTEIPAPYNLGFNTTGPWGYMRHPNYLGEQGIWISLYVFVIGAGAAGSGIFHWSMIGPLLLILLFMGSSALGESISVGKYPAYAEYIRQVHKYLPISKFNEEHDNNKNL